VVRPRLLWVLFLFLWEGAKRLAVRVGNWLSAEWGRTLISWASRLPASRSEEQSCPCVLIGCGLRGTETVAIKIEDLQPNRARTWASLI
jgi:hypothetical protein